MRPTTKKLLALSAVVSLGLAACGTDDVSTPAVSGEARPVGEETTTTTEAPEAQPVATIDDPASTLRATLGALFEEHVYLAGMAAQAVVDAGPGAPATEAAVAAVDENTAALGDLFGLVPGMDDPGELEELWQTHTEAFVAYAAGAVAQDADAVDQAESDLEAFQQDFADLLDAATDGELFADELFGEVETHVTMVTDAIDALVDEDPEAVSLLRDAAAHMGTFAADVADGVVAAHEDAFPGDPNSVAASTRAGLASNLQQHTYLAVITAQQAAAAGDAADPLVQRSVTLLQGASEDLANLVAGAVGNEARQRFLTPWRAHVDAVGGYARAAGAGDDTGVARGELDTTAGQVATAMSELTGGDVPVALGAHVAALTAAVDAVAAGDPTAPGLARAAAQVAGELATSLAGPLAEASARQDAASGQGTEGGSETDAMTGAGSGGGAAPDSASSAGGSAAGGSAGGGETSETGGSAGGDTEPPSDPSEDGGPTAEGG